MLFIKHLCPGPCVFPVINYCQECNNYSYSLYQQFSYILGVPYRPILPFLCSNNFFVKEGDANLLCSQNVQCGNNIWQFLLFGKGSATESDEFWKKSKRPSTPCLKFPKSAIWIFWLKMTPPLWHFSKNSSDLVAGSIPYIHTHLVLWVCSTKSNNAA